MTQSRAPYKKVLILTLTYLLSCCFMAILSYLTRGEIRTQYIPIAGFVALGPTGLTYLWLSTPEQRSHDIARHIHWLPLLVTGVSALYGYYVGIWEADHGSFVSEEFFTTSAQVIPVLILALTIDVRLSPDIQDRSIITVIFVAVVGEGFALQGTAFHDQRASVHFALTVGALAGLAAALIMALGATQAGESRETAPAASPPDTDSSRQGSGASLNANPEAHNRGEG